MKQVYEMVIFHCPHCGYDCCFGSHVGLNNELVYTCRGRHERGCANDFTFPQCDSWKYFKVQILKGFESKKEFDQYNSVQGTVQGTMRS